MSYCRWTSECDVYCYPSDRGFVVHVATTRNLGENIELGHDGKTFCEPTERAMFARLRFLRSTGYRIPSYAFDREVT